MKLFVSYRRKSWGFTQRLAEKLERRLDAEIFIDYEGIDEPHFAHSIMRHLRESNVVLLIVSEHTFAPDKIHRENDWVRREIREALRLGIPIVSAFVDGQPIPGDLPADIAAIHQMQGVNFYPDFFNAALIKLVGFITKATPIKQRKPQNRTRQVQRGLLEMKHGLSKIEPGKGNVKDLLAEFQSYLTSMEELLETRQPTRPADPPPEKISLHYTIKMLEELLKSPNFLLGDSDEDSEAIAAPSKPSGRANKPPEDPLMGLYHLSRLLDERPPGDPADWMFPLRPRDLPP